MRWIFSACLAASFLGLGPAHNTMFEGYDLSLSGYHLCTESNIVNHSKVMSYKMSYSVSMPCGGWLPWRTCRKTLYKTVHKNVIVPVTSTTTRCCDGYEQVGSYCALPLSQSAVFSAKPGSCPEEVTTFYNMCEWDTDCAVGQKCCPGGGISCCTDAKAEGGERGWSLNVTIVVKTNYTMLESLPQAILNHTRLLHAMVTGALGSPNISVYPLKFSPDGPFRTNTELLIGCSHPLSLRGTSSQLHLLMENVEETSHVAVKDMNECAHAELNSCSPNARCFNAEGSYNCSCLPGFVDLSPNITGQFCEGEEDYTSGYEGQEQNSTAVPYVSTTIPWTANGTTNNVMSAVWTTVSATLSAITNSTPAAPHDTMSPKTATLSVSTVSPVAASTVLSLKAVVRLTNVQFQEAFLNHSSQEYLNLTRSFEREILASLPPDIQYLVDSDAVNILITGLSRGSVVVDFLIVFTKPVTQAALNVSEALVTSLHNSSVYTVDNSTTIQDFDECDAKENDCSPDANCTNTWGSYTCVCLEGFIDTYPDRPGQTCAAVVSTTTTTSSNSTTTSPSTTTSTSITTSTSTTSSTSTTTASQKNAVPLTLAPIMSQVADIAVECRASAISVTVAKAFLSTNFIAESSLYLGRPECGVAGGNDSHVHLTANWDQCGTVLQHNKTYNSAQVTLFSNGTSGSVAPKVHLQIPVVCTYWNNILISTGYSPSGFDLIKDVIEGSGSFHVTVQLLNGSFPLPQNYSLFPNEEVVVEVAINSSMDQIKLVINQCWATPSSDPLDSTSYYFLENSCPVPETYTTVLQNGNSSSSRLAIRVFSFVQQNVIYLHCKVQICFETSGTTCRSDCIERTERAKKIIAIRSGSCGPIYRSQNSLEEDIIKSVQEVIYIVVGVGVAALIIGVLTIVCYRKRRVGHYNFNFTPKQESFTYHVFSS